MMSGRPFKRVGSQHLTDGELGDFVHIVSAKQRFGPHVAQCSSCLGRALMRNRRCTRVRAQFEALASKSLRSKLEQSAAEHLRHCQHCYSVYLDTVDRLTGCDLHTARVTQQAGTDALFGKLVAFPSLLPRGAATVRLAAKSPSRGVATVKAGAEGFQVLRRKGVTVYIAVDARNRLIAEIVSPVLHNAGVLVELGLVHKGHFTAVRSATSNRRGVAVLGSLKAVPAPTTATGYRLRLRGMRSRKLEP